MNLKKLLSIQNTQIKRAFNNKPLTLYEGYDYTKILKKYLLKENKEISVSITGRTVYIYFFDGGYQYKNRNRIEINIKTKMREEPSHTWLKSLYVYKLEVEEQYEELLEKDIKEIVKELYEATKKEISKEKKDDKERLEEVKKLFKKYGLTPKIYEDIRRKIDDLAYQTHRKLFK